MATLPSPVLVDAHVHFYPCFEREVFLDRATANFSAAAERLGGRNRTGMLLFTEGAGDHFFRQFREAAIETSNGGWSFRSTGEDESLFAVRDGEPKLVLVAGRQIVAEEDLEVLALGCDADFPDGRPLARTVEEVRESGALPVVPWGFGKWWFGRGRLLGELMMTQDASGFFLGDNRARPKGTPRPGLFARAEARGIRILPGTDPLPFPYEAKRAGSYGFTVHGELSPDRPAASLKALLRDPGVKVQPYGSGEGLLSFLRNQIAMQKRKRFGGGAA